LMTKRGAPKWPPRSSSFPSRTTWRASWRVRDPGCYAFCLTLCRTRRALGRDARRRRSPPWPAEW